MATIKEAVSTLIKNGARKVEGVTINNVNVTPCEDYVRVSLTLDKAVDGYVQDEAGVYQKGTTNVIFVSLFSITAVLKEMDEVAFAVNEIINNPQALQVILSRAKVTIIQENVAAGAVRINPFTEKEDTKVPDHDSIYNHVSEITLGKMGHIGLEKILDKLLGA